MTRETEGVRDTIRPVTVATLAAFLPLLYTCPTAAGLEPLPPAVEVKRVELHCPNSGSREWLRATMVAKEAAGGTWEFSRSIELFDGFSWWERLRGYRMRIVVDFMGTEIDPDGNREALIVEARYQRWWADKEDFQIWIKFNHKTGAYLLPAEVCKTF